MLVRLAAICMFLFAVASEAWAQAGCRDTSGTAKAPVAHATTITVKTPSGPFVVREAYRMMNCRYGSDQLNGLVDSTGRLLVPANYEKVIAISSTRALVARTPPRGQLMPTDWLYYEFGKGEAGPARGYYGAGYITQDAGYVRSSDFVIPYGLTIVGEMPEPRAPSGKALVYDYYVYFNGASTPRNFSRVGGGASQTGTSPPIGRAGDLLVAQLPDADGAPRSRLLNLNGDPISPVIGRTLAVRTLKPGPAEFSHFENPANLISRDLVAATFSTPHPDLPFADLYVPVANDGTPRQLPDSAIGVLPLLATVTPQGLPAWGREHLTYGWAVVFAAAAGGVELTYGLGSLDSVLAAAPTAPRISGMRRFYSRDVGGVQQDVIAIRSRTDGLWRSLRAMDLQPFPETETYAARTPDQAYNLYVDSRIAKMRQMQFEYAQRKAEAEARHHATSEVTFRQMLAAGTMCNQPSKALELHVPAIDYVLVNCEVYDGWFVERARAEGASRNALHFNADKRERLRELAMARALEEQRRARESEMANTRNWNLWTQQVTRSIDASTDAFMSRNRQTYYENLERWNRGQQNWGGPAN